MDFSKWKQTTIVTILASAETGNTELSRIFVEFQVEQTLSWYNTCYDMLRFCRIACNSVYLTLWLTTPSAANQDLRSQGSILSKSLSIVASKSADTCKRSWEHLSALGTLNCTGIKPGYSMMLFRYTSHIPHKRWQRTSAHLQNKFLAQLEAFYCHCLQTLQLPAFPSRSSMYDRNSPLPMRPFPSKSIWRKTCGETRNFFL